MDILIRGLEMPKCCAECSLNYDCFKWIVTGTPFFGHDRPFDDEITRLDNCPLIPAADVRPVVRGKWEKRMEEKKTPLGCKHGEDGKQCMTIL